MGIGMGVGIGLAWLCGWGGRNPWARGQATLAGGLVYSRTYASIKRW